MNRYQEWYVRSVLKRKVLKDNSPIYIECISNSNKKMVYKINEKFILKIANKRILKSEYIFFSKYTEKCFEKVLWYKGGRYIFYNCFKSNSDVSKIYKPDMYLKEVYDLVNTYKMVDKKGFGQVLALKENWADYLMDEIMCRAEDMKKKHLDILNKVIEQIEILAEYKFEKKLIHGDLGFYNIIFEGARIKGIIDPITILGDPMYDFIYFALSKPSFLKMEYVNKMITMIDEPIRKIKAMIYVVLYIRIAIEEHYDDENNYVKKYEEIWKQL